jgi:broad specificity phosphatase PhoE
MVRHAAHDNVGGFLAGRMPGVRLGVDGRAQAARLAERMRRERFEAILASPRERTQETAAAIASVAGIGEVITEPELDEIDFGHWSGRVFDDLNTDPAWRRWNEMRSLASTPNGETLLDVQRRVMRLITRLIPAGDDGGERRYVLVSHADVIKAAVMMIIGAPIDTWDRIDIAPASITRIVAGGWGAKVIGVNEVID